MKKTIKITQEVLNANQLFQDKGFGLGIKEFTDSNFPSRFNGVENVGSYYQTRTDLHEQDGFWDVEKLPLGENQKYGTIQRKGTENLYHYPLIDLTEQEIEAINLQKAYAPIQAEFDMYQKRKADGIDAYLLQSAKLRLAKLSGQITEAGHSAIEELLRPVRDEVVNGQWINAKAKLEAIGSENVGIDFYTELHTELTTYINENY